MDFFTKVYRIVAPSFALKRLQNQRAFDVLDKGTRKYEGAGKGRRFPDNSNQTHSQNQDISMSLPMLRKRSRELNKNNPYAKNGTRRIKNNVIGTGIMATPTHSAKTTVKKVKEVWNAWADDTACDFDGLQNFYGIQQLVVGTVAKSGECFIRRVWKKRDRKSKIVPLELQVLDPDFLDLSKNDKFDNGEYTVNGIQYSAAGKRKAYWLFDRHPLEHQSVSKPVPASEVIHVFEVEDPGQTNGIPLASSIILRMQDFDEYEDAQIMKQKIAACFAGFITTNADITPGGDAVDDNGIERFQPGTYQRLNHGESITFASPPSVDGFREFSRQSLQGQAAGMGISYESFTGDLSGVNFSSGRMGWLEFQRGVEVLQWNMVIPMFLKPVWNWFILAAELSGKIPTADVGVQWTAPRREMIDPLKEIQALIKQARAGFISWQEAVRQLGYSPEEIIAQMQEDKKRFDAAGVMPESDPRYDADKLMKLQEEVPENLPVS